MRIPGKSDVVANWAIVLAAMALSASYGLRILNDGGLRNPTSSNDYRFGDKVEAIKGVDYRHADRTVLLVVSSHCGSCTQSMPFFTEIVSMASRAPSRLQVIAVGLEGAEAAKAYLKQHGCHPGKVVPLQSSALRVSATPTIIAVERDGLILGVWRGLQSPDRQERILRQLIPTNE